MVRYHLIHRNRDQHVVILGGEIAGLLMARVLVDHFQRVTVIGERRLPDEPGRPANLQQALPMHVLAVQGQRHLERLFPGLTAELITAGAPTISWTADAPLLLPGGWGPRFNSDLISRPTTYNLLLHHLRQRLVEYARGHIMFLEQRQIMRIQEGAPRVTIRSAASGTETTLSADLIVDTIGQSAAAFKSLETTVVDSGKGLAVQVFQRPSGADSGWRALLVMAHGGQSGGAIIPVEGHQWLVMLNGLDHLPTTDADFMAQARALRTPVLADALHRANPLTAVFSSADSANRLWHYHQIANWPDHLIATRAARFNPALGFDLTAATIGALTLRESLDDQRKRYPDGNLMGLGSRFQKRQARALAFPWMLASAQDGPALDNRTRWLQWYGDQILAAACNEPATLKTLLAVAGLDATPRQLFSPPIVHHVWQQVRHPQVRVVESAPPAMTEKRQTITQEMAALAISND